MTEAIDILKREHRIIERVLRALNGVCQRFESGEPVPPEALRQFPDFMREFADRCHHAKEEAHLFPALERRGMAHEGGPIGVMLYEHEIGRGLVAELNQSARAYQAGDPAGGRRFVDVAGRYIDLLSRHIQKEDNILFRVAEEMLDETALAWLRQAFEQVEGALGAGTHEQYERSAMELEHTWAPEG